MTETRDSGAPWLGSVPASWEVLPAKRLFWNPREREREDDELLTPSQKFGVLPQEEFMRVSGSRVVMANSDSGSGVHVEEGDFISHLRSFQGGLEYSGYTGKVSPAYTVLRPSRQINPGYYKHLFKSSMYVQALQTTTDQLRDGQSIRYQQFGQIPLPLPPLDEQRRIADHLDREIEKIDALVAQLGALRESVQARFYRFVRSLVFGESVKNRSKAGSNFEAAGGVPENWIIDKASRLFRASKGTRGAELTVNYCAENEGDFPVFSGQTERDGVMGFIDSYEFDSGKDEWLFTTTVGAKAMSLRRVQGRFSLSQNCMIIRNQKPDRINTGFAFHYLSVLFALKRNELSEHMQASFRMGDLYEMWLMFPGLEEQKKIVQIADAEAESTARIWSLIDAVKKLLLERKQTLVTQFVTGLGGTSGDGPAQ